MKNTILAAFLLIAVVACTENNENGNNVDSVAAPIDSVAVDSCSVDSCKVDTCCKK